MNAMSVDTFTTKRRVTLVQVLALAPVGKICQKIGVVPNAVPVRAILCCWMINTQ